MNNLGCIGNTIITSTGLYFDYAVPKPEQIKIEDVAKALSNICRFGGHCNFYSVAEHSFHCAHVAYKMNLNTSDVFFALMHDSQEAYIGDMPKPLKMMMPEYQSLEDRIESAVYSAFMVDVSNRWRIKEIDLMMLKAEKLQLFPEDRETWSGFDSVMDVDVDIQCWSPTEAENHFLSVYREIVEKLQG